MRPFRKKYICSMLPSSNHTAQCVWVELNGQVVIRHNKETTSADLLHCSALLYFPVNVCVSMCVWPHAPIYNPIVQAIQMYLVICLSLPRDRLKAWTLRWVNVKKKKTKQKWTQAQYSSCPPKFHFCSTYNIYIKFMKSNFRMSQANNFLDL